MKPFSYCTAQSPESAIKLIGERGRFIGGGVDLLGELKEYLVEADTLVNIKSLPGTRQIETGSDKWTIGTNVTVTELAEHAGIRKVFPGLQQAAADVGSPQIRNVATVGGNLAQHSRCWYYRHRDVQCLKKGGGTCYAHEGENKYHSLFSGNPCISPVVSSLAIPLTALDAQVVLIQNGKKRVVPIAKIYEKAWSAPDAHNSLEPQDLILAVEIPLQKKKSAFLQVSEKTHFDWALVSCAAAARVVNGKLSGAKVVLGSVAPIPYSPATVSSFLEGKELNEATVAQAAELMLKDAKPFAHNGYKIPIAKALVKRTLLALREVA